MPTLIKPYERKVYQKGRGGISPRLQLEALARFGPDVLQRWQERQDAIAARVRARVETERANAVSRGVHVVVDETRPDEYTRVTERD